MTKRVLIAGGSGMIGHAVNLALRSAGWQVHILTRNPDLAAKDSQVHLWSPGDTLDLDALGSFDAIVNLAGSTIAKMPWTRKRRVEILDSRIRATETLVRAIAASASPPGVLVSASASGYYGSRGDEELTETSPPGKGFLADVCRAWEDAALAAPAGTRVVIIRIGLVIWKNGALAPLRTLARLFVAGPLAGGRAWWPWVGMHDVARAIVHLLSSRVSGPVNVVGPTPATSSDVIREIAAAFSRPFWLPAPGWTVKAALGKAGEELLLSSQRVIPGVLEREGFVFSTPTVDKAVEEALA